MVPLVKTAESRLTPESRVCFYKTTVRAHRTGLHSGEGTSEDEVQEDDDDDEGGEADLWDDDWDIGALTDQE
ncbi:hypothetical protein PC121_g22480 [Phytophthora cactorum]|nr:hypothetical protein PC120_g23809 [Phytophthora cactorum]KAG3043540.1 hypothetical protein PC121_g22480 [Phytophthora cactorum]